MNSINCNKEVLSFMIYMWNSWSFEECIHIFDGDIDNPYDMAHHIWNKYIDIEQRFGAISSPSHMVGQLDEDNLNAIIKRACELYYGRENK